MASSFDDIIFLLSTECFARELLAGCSEHELIIVTELARSMIPEMVRGGDNYFMCADLSTERKEMTKKKFMEAAREKNVSTKIIDEINISYNVLRGITNELTTASYVINAVAIKFYWHDFDSFISPLPDDIEKAILSVELPVLSGDHDGFEWEDRWLFSESVWDKYIMSLMDGIDEVPYLKFTKIKYFSMQLDFLREWKSVFDVSIFSALLKFIAQEAHAELDILNPLAAAEIDMLINAFQG